MGEEGGAIEPAWQEKLLFYKTTFFTLLSVFSLFAFLFLVPFVIHPAFTTIFMDFDEMPATCLTVNTLTLQGASNCSWSSCREGCNKELYECTQIYVNYKRGIEGNVMLTTPTLYTRTTTDEDDTGIEDSGRRERSIKEVSYESNEIGPEDDYATEIEATGLQPNISEWYYVGAKLFPNVMGCGYLPILNCPTFLTMYQDIGTNFPCYYSRVDPGLVISELDMDQVYMNLVFAMGIPIPTFIISVIYLTAACAMRTTIRRRKRRMPKACITPVSHIATTPIQPTSEDLTTLGSEAFEEDLTTFCH